MNVPLLDPTRENGLLHEALMAACERVLRSGHYIQGLEVEGFERACAELLGAKHAIGISSGTDALLVSLMALEVGPGDEVICPSFTFFATAGCIARLGAVPVFADVSAETFNLDPVDVRRRITSRSKAIVPVHLFGQAADMPPLLALAREHGLSVVEDAAQALGAKQDSRCCGTMGDAGTFSFFPSKNLGGFGDGGLVTTNRDDLADRIRLLRTHGARPKYFHQRVGGNFRLDALQAALLSVKLPHLAAYTQARRSHAERYANELRRTPDLVLPSVVTGSEHIWNQYTLRVRGQGRRDALRQHLAASGIGSEIYYPLPLHEQACFQHLPRVRLPVTEALADEVLSLPVFPHLTADELTAVIGAINRWSN